MFWRLRTQDLQAATAVALAAASLTDEPARPAARSAAELLRLRIGTYRVLHEIDEARSASIIHSVGLRPLDPERRLHAP